MLYKGQRAFSRKLHFATLKPPKMRPTRLFFVFSSILRFDIGAMLFYNVKNPNSFVSEFLFSLPFLYLFFLFFLLAKRAFSTPSCLVNFRPGKRKRNNRGFNYERSSVLYIKFLALQARENKRERERERIIERKQGLEEAVTEQKRKQRSCVRVR